MDLGRLVRFLLSVLLAGFLLCGVLCVGVYGQSFFSAYLQKTGFSSFVRACILGAYLIIIAHFADSFLMNIAAQVKAFLKQERSL